MPRGPLSDRNTDKGIATESSSWDALSAEPTRRTNDDEGNR